MASTIKLIIFDMDGTLYRFENGSFAQSGLQQRVLANAVQYISDKLVKPEPEAKQILADIIKRWGEDISLALEKEYGLERGEYFNTVWDIPARGLIIAQSGLKDFLVKLKGKYKLAVASDAPMVWINNVLRELSLDDVFADNVLHGEGNARKGNGNLYDVVLAKYNVKPENCLMVGDQEKSDIIPAREKGLKTVYLNQNKSTMADFNIKKLFELEDILDKKEAI